jgi:trans-aconitate methyltransferase
MPHRWDSIAHLRRTQIESGKDLTFSLVYLPWYKKLVTRLNPSAVLEIGGGTGHLAQVLSEKVPEYHVLEPSLGMFEVAKSVLGKSTAVVVNESIQKYSSGMKFDLLVSHMCVQTIAGLDEFFTAAAQYMSANAWFVFSIPHPAFYNSYKKFFASEHYSYCKESSGIVEFAVTLDPENPIAGIPYHHRPLAAYFDALHGCGLGVHLFDEVLPSEAVQKLYGDLWRVPRYLTIGARYAGQETLSASFGA